MLAVVLLGVALVPYPTLGAIGAPPAASCRLGCRAGSVPGMVSWTAPLSGAWDVVAGLTGERALDGGAEEPIADRLAERRAVGEHVRCGYGIFAESSQVLARHGARELHPRLTLLVGEIPQHADGGKGDAAHNHEDDHHVDGREPPA